MINLVYSFEVGSDVVMRDLYRYLRKNKEYTYIPDLYLINDCEIINSKDLDKVIKKTEGGQETYFVIDSIFSGCVIGKGLERLNIDFNMYWVLDKLLSFKKEGDLDFPSILLRKMLWKDISGWLFVQANRVSRIDPVFGEVSRELVLDFLSRGE